MKGLLPCFLLVASRLVCTAAEAQRLVVPPVDTTQEERRVAMLERVRQILLRAAGEDPAWFDHGAYVFPGPRRMSPCPGPGPSMNQDWDRLQREVSDIFVAYGLKPEWNAKVGERDVAAMVSVYDRALRVGFRLPDRGPSVIDWRKDITALVARGHRLCVWSGPISCTRPSPAAPSFAIAAQTTAFLDEFAGRDSGLAALFGDRRARLPLGEPSIHGDQVSFRLDPRAGYECREGDEHGEQWRHVAAPPKPGRLVILHVPVRPASWMVVDQDGAPGMHVESRGSSTILPPWFDPSRPFWVTVGTGKGCSREPHAILVGLGP